MSRLPACQTTRQMTIEYIALVSYFFFLFGLIFVANNVNRLAAHPAALAVADKIQYNLRDVPRVNYKEISSEESEGEDVVDSQQESESDAEDETEEITPLPNAYRGTESSLASLRQRYRRDRNPVSRILETVD